MGKGILTGLLEDIKEGMEDIGSNSISNSEVLKVVESKEVKAFDYSLVDANTAEFLHQKEIKITQIRVMSGVAIGKELKDTFANFAKVGYGEKTKLFDQWVQSIGMSPRAARNYINIYDYVRKNFPNIEDAEKIQTSLLIAISKPSAPLELQEAVISGDITTHKQYKELEEKLKMAEKEAQEKKRLYEMTSENYDKLEKRYFDNYDKSKKLEKELDELRQQLVGAKASGDSEEIERLKLLLQDTEKKIEELELQLNDNTEIATAVVEKVPDEIYEELEELRKQSLSTKSIEVSSEISALLKLINSSITNIISIIHKVDREGDIKGVIFSTDCLWQIKMLGEKISKLKSFSADKLDIQLFDFIKD